MTNYDLLPDLKEWAESYEAVEIGIDGVLYAVINYIEQLTDRNKELEAALRKIKAMTPDPEFGTLPIEAAIKVALAALGEKKDGNV